MESSLNKVLCDFGFSFFFSSLRLTLCFRRLYESCQWDDRTIRKLIGDGRLAARLKGGEDRDEKRNQECPICFLTYSEVNVTKCCQANICTECFLQVRPQREKQACCPFCNNEKLSIAIAEQLSADQVQEREKEEQLVVEARIRALSNDGNKKAGSPTGDFGDRLQKDERVARMRARSESIHSEENNPNVDNTTIQSLAMTPEERRSLEDEMKAQLSHPLARRMEQEAAERRLQNDNAYYRSHSGSLRDLRAQRVPEFLRGGSSRGSRYRGSGRRDWNEIVDAFERGGNGEVHSLDDLVVLEAAILLSRDENSRRAGNGEEGDEFDAARHARDGFPLVRSFLNNREGLASSREIRDVVRTLNSSRRSRNQLFRAGLGSGSRGASTMPDTALDTAAMLMRGISEEEQIAMAIAASLQDSNENQAGEASETESTGEAENEEELVVTGELDDDDEEESVSAGNAPSIGLEEEGDHEEADTGSEVEQADPSTEEEGEGAMPSEEPESSIDPITSSNAATSPDIVDSDSERSSAQSDSDELLPDNANTLDRGAAPRTEESGNTTGQMRNIAEEEQIAIAIATSLQDSNENQVDEAGEMESAGEAENEGELAGTGELDDDDEEESVSAGSTPSIGLEEEGVYEQADTGSEVEQADPSTEEEDEGAMPSEEP